MSTSIVKIQDGQQVTLSDFQNLAEDPRSLADLITRHMLETGQKYMGGTVTKTAVTTVNVSTPVLFVKGGRLYSRDDLNGIDINLLSLLSISGYKRIVAIVASGEAVDDQTEARDFEVDGSVYPPVVEAQPTATRNYRRANIATVVGEAAPTPVKPTVDISLTVLAYVTLTSTEVSEIEQITSTRLRPLSAVNDDVVALNTWQGRIDPMITGMRSDLAGLSAASGNQTQLGYIMEQLARVTEMMGVAPDAAYSKSDFFLDTRGTDLEHINYLALTEEGIRFDWANKDTDHLALLNPADTSVVVHSNGVLLPVYDPVTIISVLGKDAEVALSNGGAQGIDYVQKTRSRQRIRYGNSYTYCTNSAWWQTGRYDPFTRIFQRAGETFEVRDNPDTHGGEAHFVRVRQYWMDTYDEIYWEAVVYQASYTGNVCAQSFLAQQSRWITAFKFGFSRVDTGGGDVRLLLCECNTAGAPDMNGVIGVTTIAYADLKTYPTLTSVNFPPTLIKAGKRYAWVMITPGNHWLAMVSNNKFAQGSFFVSTDAAWFQGDISRDACFEIVAAQFRAPRLAINLENWNLDGGLTDLDLSLEALTTDAATIDFEIRVQGNWITLGPNGDANHPLYGVPAAVDARMVMQGTTEMMPGIHLSTSYVTRQRPRTSLVHISTANAMPAPVTEVQIIETLEFFNDTDHDVTVSLLHGTGYTTETAASSVKDVVIGDGNTRRTWTFTGLPSLTSFKVKTTGATTSALSVFHVAEATYIAYP